MLRQAHPDHHRQPPIDRRTFRSRSSSITIALFPVVNHRFFGTAKYVSFLCLSYAEVIDVSVGHVRTFAHWRDWQAHHTQKACQRYAGKSQNRNAVNTNNAMRFSAIPSPFIQGKANNAMQLKPNPLASRVPI
jgi:hypothetical protein